MPGLNTMALDFYKYHGTGNDFIIIDNRKEVALHLTRSQIKSLCDRHFGIGADGLMLLNEKSGYDFEMIYYNSDGNTSSMCGNGGRCLVRFAYDLGLRKTNYRFLASDGAHEAEVTDHKFVKLKMQDVGEVENHPSYAVLNTGSPHYVKFTNAVRTMDVVKEGRAIRFNNIYKAKGINVNFIENTDADEIFVRTYERGVEDETLSCGTGVTAAALISAHNDRGFNNVRVETKGGNLNVEFNKTSDTSFTDIWLCGPAAFVFKGSVNLPESHDPVL